jgi:hypothetical protein
MVKKAHPEWNFWMNSYMLPYFWISNVIKKRHKKNGILFFKRMPFKYWTNFY